MSFNEIGGMNFGLG